MTEKQVDDYNINTDVSEEFNINQVLPVEGRSAYQDINEYTVEARKLFIELYRYICAIFEIIRQSAAYDPTELRWLYVREETNEVGKKRYIPRIEASLYYKLQSLNIFSSEMALLALKIFKNERSKDKEEYPKGWKYIPFKFAEESENQYQLLSTKTINEIIRDKIVEDDDTVIMSAHGTTEAMRRAITQGSPVLGVIDNFNNKCLKDYMVEFLKIILSRIRIYLNDDKRMLKVKSKYPEMCEEIKELVDVVLLQLNFEKNTITIKNLFNKEYSEFLKGLDDEYTERFKREYLQEALKD